MILKINRNIDKYFTIILESDINDFLINEDYFSKFDIILYKNIVNILNPYSYDNYYKYKNNDYPMSIEKKGGINGDENIEKENFNYYIIQLLHDKKYYDKLGNIISIDDVIEIDNFSIIQDETYPLSTNIELTRQFIDKQIKFQLGRQSYQYNKKSLDDRLYTYSNKFNGTNEDNYLFRTCGFDEIKNLLINKIIYPSKYYHNIYLSYNSEYALNRMTDNSDYLVIYDKQKLINQGVKILPESYLDWNEIQQIIKYQSGGEQDLSLDNPQNLRKFNEYIKNNPNIDPRSITLNDLGILCEYEAVIPQIKFEHGLVYNILIIMSNEKLHQDLIEIEYYRKYNKIKKLIEEYSIEIKLI
jgi:hypothetical protein